MRKRPKPKSSTNAAKSRKPVLQAANDNRPAVMRRSAERLLCSAEHPELVNATYGSSPAAPDELAAFLMPYDLLVPVLPGRIPMSLNFGDLAFDADMPSSVVLYTAPRMARALGVEADPPERQRQAAEEHIMWAHDNGLLMLPEYSGPVAACMAVLLLSSVPRKTFMAGGIEWCDIDMEFTADGRPDFQVYGGSLAQYTAWMKRR